MSKPPQIKPKLSAWQEIIWRWDRKCFCFFVFLGEQTLLKRGVSLCNPLQRQVSRSCIGCPSVSCGILGIAFIQLCLLWCITKPFFTPVLLCCSIITTVAEHWHALLRGVSINISVSSTNHHGWLWRCVCVCVCWWVSTWACMQMQL